MVLFLTPRAAEFTRSRCWPATQELVTLLPLSFSARIVWSRSTNVTVLTCPSDMRVPILEVSTSWYPPLGARYWSAISTPTTATTIHSHGPRKIRLTSMSRGHCPDLLPARTIDRIDGTRGFQRRRPGQPFPSLSPDRRDLTPPGPPVTTWRPPATPCDPLARRRPDAERSRTGAR